MDIRFKYSRPFTAPTPESSPSCEMNAFKNPLLEGGQLLRYKYCAGSADHMAFRQTDRNSSLSSFVHFSIVTNNSKTPKILEAILI